MTRDQLLLADDMGLGKTLQVTAALRIMWLQGTVQSALLIVPASLIDQWRRELRKWAPELRVLAIRGTAPDRAWQWRAQGYLKIVSYETFRNDFTDNVESPLRKEFWDVVILDEAQKIKNRDIAVSRSAKLLRRRRSWALTGTPLENSIDDLASVMEFVDHTDGGTQRRYTAGPELMARHRELQLRRRKADVLTELPSKTVISISLPLLSGQQASYDKAEREGVVQLRDRGEAVQVQHVLELIMRLKQLCNRDPRTGESAKFSDIRERLEVLVGEGHRALLFSQYVNDAFGVEAVANTIGDFSPLTFTGGMSGSQRDATIQRFKENASHKALVLSLKAGGVGLNLQEASYVFHVDRWWNPAIERQAEDRSYRMGQVFPVTVYKYTCEGTIEQRIDELLKQKQQLFDEVIDDVSLDISGRLSAEEIFSLFGLTSPIVATVRECRDGLDLEDRCALILESSGWAVERTARSHDGGVDLIATKVDTVGLEQKIFVQCKDHARKVGVEVVRELLGVLPPDQKIQAVVAAPAGATAEATSLAAGRGVKIWDEAFLADLESGRASD
ncbi:MAG: ATP-dependent helicase [Dehalococcoidia bacterium]|nr:ATP-dependent helicase [Dehalococcoidia bacterium]